MSGKTGPLSLTEIEFYVTRAAAGAGAPFGIGEAVAAGVCRLAAQDKLDWAALARALEALGEGRSVAQPEQAAPERPLSALLAGPLSVWDKAGAEARRPVDEAALAAALSAALASDVAPPPKGGVQAPLPAWRVVKCWFHATLVPSTDVSRESGAGAGLLDED